MTEDVKLLEGAIAKMVEDAYRSGWRDGYHAGYSDGGSDFDYGDIESDWEKFRTRVSHKEGENG